MIKKISTLFAVLVFASSASVAFACPSKGGDDSDTGATKLSIVDVAGSGCSDSCGGGEKDEA